MAANPSPTASALETLPEVAVPGQLAERGIDAIRVFSLPLRTEFRNLLTRDGLLLHGPHGWGEASPFWNYSPPVAARWLRSGVEVATTPPLPTIRQRIAVNATIPLGSPAAAYATVTRLRCPTVKVKVAGKGTNHGLDCERLRQVRAALDDLIAAGLVTPPGRIRIDANAAWDPHTAASFIADYERAAGGLDYVEQPCAEIEQLVQLRRMIDVPIAADESIRLGPDPFAVAAAGAADVAIIKVQPLGGPRAAARIAAGLGLPVVISSALDTGVGISAAARTAAALPSLGGACGLGTVNLFFGDVVNPPLLPVAGYLDASQWQPVEQLAPTPLPTPLPTPDAAAGSEPATATPLATASTQLVAAWRQRLEQMCHHLDQERF